MDEEFDYKQVRVSAGVSQRRVDGRGGWVGVVSLSDSADTTTHCLEEAMFDWPAAARRYAVRCAKAMIDARADQRAGSLRASPTVP